MENIANIPIQLWDEDFRFLKLRVKGKEPTADMGGWQDNNFSFNDPELLKHLSMGGNYGIIGGYANLILIDSDSEEITEIAESLPKTFTIKTGSPEVYKKHYFFRADKKVKPIRLSKEHQGDLGDVRSVGQYVVAPNCLHPKGGIYEVIKDIPIEYITEEEIRKVFSKYIDKKESTKFKEFKPDTRLRNTKFIRECLVPDYCKENKLKGETSKNWKLFPYLVDVLHNRQVSIQIYKDILEKQGHKVGAIKGWVKLASEGKLAKTSCKKMTEYLERFHEEDVEKICGGCPLYQTKKEINTIKKKENLSKIQKEALICLALKDKDKATELIVNKIEDENFIYTTRDDKSSEMWIYLEGIFVPQGKSFVREIVRKVLSKAFTPQLANNIIAKIEADTYIEQDKFFRTNYVNEVPVLNGILNIRTRELSEFNPEKIFFNKLPILYDPSAECENIITHFKTILRDPEDVYVMIELFGYLLLKEYKIEKAFMFLGDGRNGKSKTIELMKRFLGPENCSSIPLRSLNEESFTLNELFGKMSNLASDLSKTDLKETGTIKSLIGRDTIQAKRKFLRDLSFVNYAKMIFAANELPRIYDTTDGFWTKWILLEFPYKFINYKEFEKLDEVKKEKHRIMNPDIIEQLTTKEELSGLLNLALDGLDKIIKEKDFSYSKGTEEVKDLWIRKSDSFTAFCYDHIEESMNEEISKKKLRKLFFNYRKKHDNLPGASDKLINITLQNIFGVSERQGSDYERYWVGIKFKNGEKINS